MAWLELVVTLLGREWASEETRLGDAAGVVCSGMGAAVKTPLLLLLVVVVVLVVLLLLMAVALACFLPLLLRRVPLLLRRVLPPEPQGPADAWPLARVQQVLVPCDPVACVGTSESRPERRRLNFRRRRVII